MLTFFIGLSRDLQIITSNKEAFLLHNILKMMIRVLVRHVQKLEEFMNERSALRFY